MNWIVENLNIYKATPHGISEKKKKKKRLLKMETMNIEDGY